MRKIENCAIKFGRNVLNWSLTSAFRKLYIKSWRMQILYTVCSRGLINSDAAAAPARQPEIFSRDFAN